MLDEPIWDMMFHEHILLSILLEMGKYLNTYINTKLWYHRFGLFEAMSAIEMMDVKMDAGMMCNQIRRKVLDLPQSIEVKRFAHFPI